MQMGDFLLVAYPLFCLLQWESLASITITSLWQASPRLRFNKEGSLLAVTTSDNGIKILANAEGQRLIRMLESRTFDNSRGPVQQTTATVKVFVDFTFSNLILEIKFMHIGFQAVALGIFDKLYEIGKILCNRNFFPKF